MAYFLRILLLAGVSSVVFSAHAEDSQEVTVDLAAPKHESSEVTVPELVPLNSLKLPDPPVHKNEHATLEDALAYVYEHHPQLLAEREKVKSVDESLSQALAGFRPDVAADYSKGRERRSSNNAAWSYQDTESHALTVTQPLFSGLDSVSAYKAATQRVRAARADLIALEQQLLFNAVVAYTGLQEAQSVLTLSQSNVDVLTKQREMTKIRFDVGELTKTDVAQADARLAAAKATEQQALGNVAIAQAGFLRAVGYSAQETLAMPELPPALPDNLPDAANIARNASPVLEAAKHREKAFAEDINTSFGSVLPDVSLQGRMVRSEGGNVFSSSYDTDAITLNVSIPLYQSGAEWSRIRAARNVAHQATFNTLDTQLAVEQDVASAWHNYTTASSIITSQKAAAKATKIALDGVRNEQEFGVRTVLDTLNAEQEYMDAHVALVRAERNHIIQAYRLMASVGKLTTEALLLPVKKYNVDENTQRAKYQLIGW